MELTLWTYEGPPHVGAIRIAASMRDVHLMLHSPQGDTYADLLFTMISAMGNDRPLPTRHSRLVILEHPPRRWLFSRFASLLSDLSRRF